MEANLPQFLAKGIKNNNNGNFSYAHSVLQSLSNLDTSKEFIRAYEFDKINPNFLLTKELYALIFVLNGGNQGLSNDIIQKFKDYYYKNQSSIQSKNVLKEDPFHFLFFLLQFVHLESNDPKNPNYNMNLLSNQNLGNKQNDDFMFNLYMEFFNQTQNSLIADNFFNIERYLYQCPNCNQYFSYGMKTVLRIDVQEVFNHRNTKSSSNNNNKIDINDCFNYYNDKITLIIVFERNNHYNNYNDIDFPINLDIKDFISQKRSSMFNINTNYVLNSCISYDVNYNNYFADCCIKKNNNTNYYRFINGDVLYINDLIEIYKYETQVLIYELSSQVNNINNYYYSSNSINQNMNNSNQFNNSYNQINNNQIYNNNQINNNQIYNNNQINYNNNQ